jgi:hypothetical protein
MKKVIFFLALIALVASACSPQPDEKAIQTAIAKTQAALPTVMPLPTNTPQPTLVPLSEIDFEPYLIKSGDLPAGFSTGQLQRNPPTAKGMPDAINSLKFEFAKDGNQAGFARVYLFKNSTDANIVYHSWAETSKTTYPIKGIGPNAFAWSDTLALTFAIKYYSLAVYQNCNMAVYIQFEGISDSSSSATYANNLNSRLKEIACREN